VNVFAQSRRRTLALCVMAAVVVLAALPMAASAHHGQSPRRTPIVLFPAWHFTRLQVIVKNQKVDPACPSSGTFEDLVFFDPGPPFSQVCRDELLTLRYKPNKHLPMRLRFSEQKGVKVRIADYGKTQSAPSYEPMYQALEAAGYKRNRDIRVAGYDARLTPDMAGFLQRSKKLIEKTYRDNGRRPVHLVGHSNGPIYVQ
jgi:lecithin-cholesterol acyltransferase